MTNFFKKNESFTANQYGFGIKRSCSQTICEVLDTLEMRSINVTEEIHTLLI